MRGLTLYLKVIEMNRRRNRLILSERAAAQERRSQQKDRLLAELQANEIRMAVSRADRLRRVCRSGRSGRLDPSLRAVVGPGPTPVQVLRVGQEVDVRVVGVDRENRRLPSASSRSRKIRGRASS